MSSHRHRFTTLTLTVCTVLCGACSDAPVVLYCSVDQEFAKQVIAAFEQRTGIQVAPVYDTEAGKTTGLVERIKAERDRPRADVFWSSEIFNTIVLARRDLFDRYKSPAAADIPDRYKDSLGRWTAFGTRARVFAYHRDSVSPDALPERWSDLASLPPETKLALADPQFGTTRGHVAAFFALWGDRDATAFLEALRANGAVVTAGNAHAVRLTARGQVAACMTDTDDVRVARANGEPINMIFPDMGDGGTLLIPNTVAIIKGGPNPKPARKLVDFLVSTEVERMLAESESGNYPVRDELAKALNMTRPLESKISFEEVADAMPAAIERARAILGQ